MGCFPKSVYCCSFCVPCSSNTTWLSIIYFVLLSVPLISSCVVWIWITPKGKYSSKETRNVEEYLILQTCEWDIPLTQVEVYACSIQLVFVLQGEYVVSVYKLHRLHVVLNIGITFRKMSVWYTFKEKSLNIHYLTSHF